MGNARTQGPYVRGGGRHGLGNVSNVTQLQGSYLPYLPEGGNFRLSQATLPQSFIRRLRAQSVPFEGFWEFHPQTLPPQKRAFWEDWDHKTFPMHSSPRTAPGVLQRRGLGAIFVQKDQDTSPVEMGWSAWQRRCARMVMAHDSSVCALRCRRPCTWPCTRPTCSFWQWYGWAADEMFTARCGGSGGAGGGAGAGGASPGVRRRALIRVRHSHGSLLTVLQRSIGVTGSVTRGVSFVQLENGLSPRTLGS